MSFGERRRGRGVRDAALQRTLTMRKKKGKSLKIPPMQGNQAIWSRRRGLSATLSTGCKLKKSRHEQLLQARLRSDKMPSKAGTESVVHSRLPGNFPPSHNASEAEIRCWPVAPLVFPTWLARKARDALLPNLAWFDARTRGSFHWPSHLGTSQKR